MLDVPKAAKLISLLIEEVIQSLLTHPVSVTQTGLPPATPSVTLRPALNRVWALEIGFA